MVAEGESSAANKVLRTQVSGDSPFLRVRCMRISRFAESLIKSSGSRQMAENFQKLDEVKHDMFRRAKALGLQPAMRVAIDHSSSSFWQRLCQCWNVLRGGETLICVLLSERNISLLSHGDK